MDRFAALGLPFFALAACGDDGGGGGSATVPPARNHGEVVVSFTIQEAATSGLSARSFEISVFESKSATSAMVLTDADVIVQTPDGTALTPDTRLSKDDVLVVSFTSPSGKLTRDALDYEVELSGRNHGGLQINGVDATNAEALSLLASAGEALSREGYKTTGPVFEDISVDPDDDATLTLTFSEALHPGSVQADDFQFIDLSDASVVGVQDAGLVDGKSDEVRLKLAGDLSTEGGYPVIQAGTLQGTDNIGNEAFPGRITPANEATLGSTIGVATNVEVPYARAEQKSITPDTALEPHFLFAVFYAEGIQLQIGTGGQGITSTEIARSIFKLQIDPGETRNPDRFVDSANFEIHDAFFTLNGKEVAAGTGDLELLGPISSSIGNRRGDFDTIFLTIDSRTRSGSADAPVDLYLAAAVEDVYAFPDGTPIDSKHLTLGFLGADLVAGAD